MNNVRKEDRLFSIPNAEHSNIFVGTNSISTCSELIGWEICRYKHAKAAAMNARKLDKRNGKWEKIVETDRNKYSDRLFSMR